MYKRKFGGAVRKRGGPPRRRGGRTGFGRGRPIASGYVKRPAPARPWWGRRTAKNISRKRFNRARRTFRPDNLPDSFTLRMKQELEFSTTASLTAANPHFTPVDGRPNGNQNWLPPNGDDALGQQYWNNYQYHKLVSVSWKVHNFRRHTEITRRIPAGTQPFATPATTTVESIDSGTPAQPYYVYYDRGTQSGMSAPIQTSLEDWSKVKVTGPESHFWGKVNCRPDVTQHHYQGYQEFYTKYQNWATYCRDENLNGRYLWADANSASAANNIQHLGCVFFPGDLVADSTFKAGSATSPQVTGEDGISFDVAVYTTWKLSKRLRTTASPP